MEIYIVHIIVDIYEVDLQLFLVDISGVRDGGAQVCSLQKFRKLWQVAGGR